MSEILNHTPVSARVLVVDDEPRNRELLRDLLETQGYAVTEAADGREALALALQIMPHAILLDVMMPGMDGFEVCRQLKANSETAPIPVLMVTALDDRDDRLKGIEAGASDFLGKPVDRQDIVLRTRNAVYAKQLYDHVQENLIKLQNLEQLRDSLVHMVVHDMRSPLMGVTGNLEIMEMNLGASLKQNDREILEDAMTSARRLVDMTSSLLDVSRMEAGKMPLRLESCDLGQVASEAVKWLGGLLRRSPVVVFSDPDVGPVQCDKEVVRRVLCNLLANASKFSPEEREIKVSIRREEGLVRVSVRDEGPGIPAEYQERIFEKYGQADSQNQRKGYSSGLGLTFCKLAVERHGGRIGVESVPGCGSTFWFTLPCDQRPEETSDLPFRSSQNR